MASQGGHPGRTLIALTVIIAGLAGLIAVSGNWTPKLLKAAFNYQYSQKDPGAFVHNPKYVIQFLIDSIEDLGGDVSKYTRPEVPAPAQ